MKSVRTILADAASPASVCARHPGRRARSIVRGSVLNARARFHYLPPVPSPNPPSLRPIQPHFEHPLVDERSAPTTSRAEANR